MVVIVVTVLSAKDSSPYGIAEWLKSYSVAFPKSTVKFNVGKGCRLRENLVNLLNILS